MPIFKEKDFEKFAEHIVQRYLTDNVKLANSAAELAMGNNMNPDQINQMVQAANTMAFLKLMEQAKQTQAPDLTQEFEPVQSNDVLQQMLGQAGGQQQQAPQMPGQPSMSPGMEQGMNPLQGLGQEAGMDGGIEEGGEPDFADQEGAEGEQTLEEPDAEENEGPFPSPKGKLKENKPKKKEKKEYDKKEKNKKEASVILNRRLIEELSSQRIALDYEFEDGVTKLAKEFRKVYGPSFVMFEKDAMSEYGHTSLPVLNAIREKLGMAERTIVDSGKIKIATVNGIVEHERVVEDSAVNKKLASVMKTIKRAMLLDTELEKLNGQK